MADEQPDDDEVKGHEDSGGIPGDPFTEAVKDVEPPEVDEVRSWIGFRLDEIGGAAVGKVEGVFIDPKTRDVTLLLARMGRFGHYSAVPFSHAVAGAGRVWLPYDRSQIRSAPQVEPDAELTREAELAICGHFEIPESVGRAAEVAKRDQGSVTSVPA